MNVLSGSSNRAFVTGWTTIRSVTVTRDAVGETTLKLYDGLDDVGDEKIVVVAAARDTVNVHFNGVDFPDGVIIVPSANMEHYIVEYEHKQTPQ